MIKVDMLIKGGRVIDPSLGIDFVRDIVIDNGCFIDPGSEVVEAETVIDATDHIVTPGLIDFHLHIAHRTSSISINPDIFLMSNGITSANDAGSTGTICTEGFILDIAYKSPLTIKTWINVLPLGIPVHSYPPDEITLSGHEYHELKYLLDRYPDNILGIKLWSKLGGRSLEESLKLAELLETKLCIHACASIREYEEVLSLVRKDDIISHFYQDQGSNILDAKGKVKKSAWEAKERGVVFDTANGKGNYSYDLAKKAIKQGFFPNIISSDCTNGLTAWTKFSFALPYVMTGYYALGMPLNEIIRAVTETPARLMGMEGKIGTLKPGAFADVTIIKIDYTPHKICDARNSTPVESRGMLIPQVTIKNGIIAYRRMEFLFLR